jgi:hypothetical protein
MDDYTTDDVLEALAPIASLLSKSEKAQHKVASGTWQHTMLGDNIKALRLALALIGGEGGQSSTATRADLEEALHALDSMIRRVEDTQTKFAAGTSQHSLQRNRLKALRIARSAVMAVMGAS